MSHLEFLSTPITHLKGVLEDDMQRLIDAYNASYDFDAMTLDGLRVHPRNDASPHQRIESTLWHMISEKDATGKKREYQRDRASFLRWCPEIIENAIHEKLHVWRQELDENNVRCFLWARECKYVVILQDLRFDRKKPFRAFKFVTAYNVDKHWMEKNLQESFDKRDEWILNGRKE